MTVLDRRQAERAYRDTIWAVSHSKALVGKLVDFDLAATDLTGDLDRILANLETDRDTYRDWLRE